LIDEGSLPTEQFPDPDGDGHGQPGTESVLECPPPPGYAPNDDDCLELDATAYPGAMEVCDGRDNDCDNLSDERVKPTCGVGWCRRESWSCKEEDCTPGDPRTEECNAFDDDCDDSIDEGAECGAGKMCEAGYCVPDAPASGASGAGGQGAAAGQGGAAGKAGASGQGGTAGVNTAGGASDPVMQAGSTEPTSSASACAVQRAGAMQPWASYLALVLLFGARLRKRRLQSRAL
jgi:hypothetical protein